MAKKWLWILLLAFLVFAPPVSAAGTWTLSFDIKANWYAHMERLDIYVDNTKASQLSASNFSSDTLNGNAPVSPKHVDIDLSSYAAANSRVKLRLYKITGAGSPWILLSNVSILHNGKYARYTDWTINKNPAGTGLTLKQIYGNEQRLVFLHSSAFDGPVGSGDYAEFVSSPLQDSAELEIKPSDISFTPETPIATAPQAVTISATVRNTGSLDTGNTVKAELWINGAKQGETPFFSVPSGGSATNSFSYTYGGALDKVEIWVSSADDARTYNNNAVRYLAPAKPYMYFRNFADAPIEKYKTIAPYSSMRSQILNYAGVYKSSPGILGYKIKNIAAAYLLKNDASYADVATNALLNISQCKGTSFAGHPYVDCEGDVTSYMDSFDMLREYIFKNRNADYYTIQQTLAEIVSDAKWRSFNYYAFEFIEAFPRNAMIGDVNNHQIAENSLIISSASGLLDYHGNRTDELDASRTAEIAAKNMLGESYVGAPLPAARLVTGEGGYGMEGGYKFQYLGWLSKAMAVYGSAYENPLAKYPLARGILDMPVWHTLPIGCEPPEKGLSSGVSSWGDEQLLLNLFEGQGKKNLQWYIDNVLKKSYCSQASGPDAVDNGFIYDSQYTAPAKPSWGPTDSYFSAPNAMAILRNGYAPDYNATYLRLAGHKDGVWGNAETSHSYQGSYTIWSKNAYLVSERADERDFTVFLPNDGGFGYSSFIFNNWLTFSILDQFGNQSNPATLEGYIASKNMDAAYMKTRISKLQDVSSGITGSASIAWDRNVLFPSMEYYIIADHLVSASPYDFDMAVHYGGTEPDLASAKYDGHYPVIGALAIGGQSVGWWGNWSLTNETVTKTTNIARWSTKSMSTPISVPLPSHDVELITFIAPATGITNYRAAQEFGSYAKPSGYLWHPYIRSRQSGTDVKYLTVQYPRDITAGDAEPSLQQIAVSGGTGNDYAIKLARGTVTDIASISDGESIVADSMATDAEIAFSRYDMGLRYFMMKNGASFSYGGAQKVALSARAPYFVLNYNAFDNITFKLSGTGTVSVTLKGMASSNYAVKRGGLPYPNFVKSGTDLIITTDISGQEFEVIPTGPDTVAPTVLSTDPINNSIDVPADKNIRIAFSENIVSGVAYGGIALKNASGATIGIASSIGGSILTISPSANLSYNASYTVELPASAVADASSNAFANSYVFGFTTAPKVTSKVAYADVLTYFYPDGTITYSGSTFGKSLTGISALTASGNVSVLADKFNNSFANFSADASGYVAFTVNSLKPNTKYHIKKDSVLLYDVLTDTSGKMTFNNSVW